MKKILLIFILGLICLSCKKGNQSNNENGLVIVGNGALKGLENKEGRRVLDEKYDKIEFLSEKFIKVCNKLSCGIYDIDGNEIIPLVTTDILEIYDSKYFVAAIGKYKAIFNLSGEQIVDKHDEVHSYSKGIIIMSKKVIVDNLELENKFFVYDLTNSNSKLNSSKGYRNFVHLLNPLENRTSFLFKTSNNYVFDINNYQIKEFAHYSEVLSYGEGLFIVQNNNHFKGFANQYGKMVFKMVFLGAKPFKNGKAEVSLVAGQDFLIDSNGNCVQDCPSEKLLKHKGIKGWVN